MPYLVNWFKTNHNRSRPASKVAIGRSYPTQVDLPAYRTEPTLGLSLAALMSIPASIEARQVSRDRATR
jgi:hypothetical protein